MYKGKTILGLVPARGGSKGIPRKNIAILSGKPLIAFTLKQAQLSRYLDKIIVSTDDNEIAAISKQYGAEVPFRRPRYLASDTARAIDVILHAINWLEKKGRRYDLIMLLQPTSPLKIAEDIDGSIELLFSKKAEAVVSVCKTEHNPLWSNTLPANGCMNNFLKAKIINKNRQDLPDFYRLTGAIYLAFSHYLKTQKTFLTSKTYAYIMPQERSIDIDSAVDFSFAEFLLAGDYK